MDAIVAIAVSAVADFLLSRSRNPQPVLCAMPNYPPLVEAISRRHPVQLVPLSCGAGATSVRPLIDAIRSDTPAVVLQTVTNPTGTFVAESDIAELIAAAGPETMFILDECHECVGPERLRGACRADPRVIRINSLSKSYSVPGLKIGWILASTAFIAEFYEYASTSYGGPPSFFYTLVEVAARLERTLLLDIDCAFRDLLDVEGVAVFPGILTYCLGGDWVRITTARDPIMLAESLRRLASFLQT